MVHKDTILLAGRLRRLELHAAQSGREVLRVLIEVLDGSQQISVSGLAEELHENIRTVLASLPPYAPPLNNINRVLLLLEDAVGSCRSVEEVKRQLGALQKDTPDAQANRLGIAKHLAETLAPGTVIYTHTLSETVLGVLLELHRMRKLERVIVTESRPNNDGWDTAQRLAEHDLEVHLTIDAAMPEAIENAHLMLSGAEIIQLDGSVVGKIGAYPAAVLCQRYHKPLYIIADSNKVNYTHWSDFYLNPITNEALGLDFSHPCLHIDGRYFDVTPPDLIKAYATEKGLISAGELPSLISDMKVSAWLAQYLDNGLQNKPQVSRKEKKL